MPKLTRLFSSKVRYCLLATLLLVAVSFFIFEKNNAVRISKRFYYQTQAALVLALEKDFDVMLNVKFHKQKHPLSCEIASLKVALDFYGLNIPESQLLADLPFDTKEPRSKDNIWGDPDKGFVGNIDGKIPNGGYGVYEKPIAELAKKHRDAKVMENPSLSDLLEEVAKQHPVIVWGTVGSGKDIYWKTKSGKKIKAIHGEHTRVVISFSGTVSNPKKIFFMDSIYGKRVMSKEKFLAEWALLDNKAVVVY